MKEHENKTNPTDKFEDAVKVVQAAIKPKRNSTNRLPILRNRTLSCLKGRPRKATAVI